MNKTPKRISVIVAVALLACTAVMPVQAAAQEDRKAKALFEEGVELFAKERYPAALAKFQLSYDIKPVAGVLYNLAMCQKAIGDYVAAIESFKMYLKKKGAKLPADQKKEIRDLIAEMQRDLGKIEIRSSVSGIRVYVDGDEFGTTPLSGPIPVSPGSHKIMALARDRDPVEREVVVDSGGKVEVNLDELLGVAKPAAEKKTAPKTAAAPMKKGEILIEGDLRGRKVRVNGREIKSTPFKMAAEPGRYEIVVVELELGGLERKRVVSVKSDRQTKFRLPRPIEPVRPDGKPAENLKQEAGTTFSEPAIGEPGKGNKAKRNAAGAVALIFGGGTVVLVLGAATMKTNSTDYDDTTANLLFIGSGVCAIGMAISLGVLSKYTKKKKVAFSPLPNGLGLSMRGEF